MFTINPANNSFEAGTTTTPASWTSGGSFSGQGVQARPAAFAGGNIFYAGSIGASAQNIITQVVSLGAATAGHQVQVTSRFYRDNTVVTGSWAAVLQLTFLDSGGSAIGSTLETTGFGSAPRTWDRLAVTGIVPSGAVSIRIGVGTRSTGASGFSDVWHDMVTAAAYQATEFILENGSFEEGSQTVPVGWTAPGTYFGQGSGENAAIDGLRFFYGGQVPSGDENILSQVVSLGGLPTGGLYEASFRFLRDMAGTVTLDQEAVLRVTFLDSGGSDIGTPSEVSSTGAGTPGRTWLPLTLSGTVPTGAVSVRIGMGVRTLAPLPAVWTDVWMDQVSFAADIPTGTSLRLTETHIQAAYGEASALRLSQSEIKALYQSAAEIRLSGAYIQVLRSIRQRKPANVNLISTGIDPTAPSILDIISNPNL